ncbi:MAG: YceI family protein [Saprospiraceae bacterium]|nr:YceI family protein [Saprospiraceae bacterium]MCB9322416.1 YceI family protein [Lewinellaceae bacterium]
MKYLPIPVLLLLFSSFSSQDEKVFRVSDGNVHFLSEAPLEIIKASSTELKGALDTEKGTFAFSVSLKSFEGFNSPLQKVHFNENYIESNRFPATTFAGKLIEKYDLSQDGTYSVRAKGKFTVHGITQERIIKSQVVVKSGKINIQASFTVLLEDHDIEIPKIVFQKIAEEIKVTLEANLQIQ